VAHLTSTTQLSQPNFYTGDTNPQLIHNLVI
jgi:hypothetical protein